MNQNTPNNITVADLLSENIEIASPPEIFLKVTEILDNPSRSAVDAGKVIENDPGLTGRLLKIVNSAYFGFTSSITTVARAIPIIGTVELRNLVLATVVIDRFRKLNARNPSMREFWIASVRCALYAKAFTKKMPQLTDPPSLFVCGLLHNLGNLILFDRAPELVNAAADLALSAEISYEAAEEKVFGFDHYEVGAELAILWRLPEIIEKTIRYHNQCDLNQEYRDEIAIVSIAHCLSNRATPDDDSELLNLAGNSRIQQLLQDQDDLIESVREEVDIQFPEIFQLIYHS